MRDLCLIACDPAPLDGDEDSHETEARSANGDKVIVRVGSSAGPVARETALRMSAFPEIAKTCPLNLFQQEVIAIFRMSGYRGSSLRYMGEVGNPCTGRYAAAYAGCIGDLSDLYNT